jgi:hypothetical protein
MYRRRNVSKALSMLQKIEAVFQGSRGGAASVASLCEAERWVYELGVCSGDAFCREKASFLLAYSVDYFSDTRHAKYRIGSAPGLFVLRDRIFETIAAMRKRLEQMSTGESTLSAASLTKR